MGDRGGNGLGAMIAGAGGTFVLAALVFRGFASRQCLTRSTKTPTSVPSSKRSTPRLVTASAVLIHDQADRDARLLSATPLPRRTWRRLGRHHRHADNASGALGGKRYGCSARSSLPSNVRRAGRAGERRGTRPLFAPPRDARPAPLQATERLVMRRRVRGGLREARAAWSWPPGSVATLAASPVGPLGASLSRDETDRRSDLAGGGYRVHRRNHFWVSAGGCVPPAHLRVLGLRARRDDLRDDPRGVRRWHVEPRVPRSRARARRPPIVGTSRVVSTV
jgi:hypothetical protein